jgi:uncharacterized protein (TIGR00730 family)
MTASIKGSIIESNTQFLDGPSGRGKELLFSFNVFAQFIKGFRILHFVGPCISVFGSARFQAGHDNCQLSYDIGKSIASLGFTVMTGGGPGVMEAANKGAFENGGTSVGCTIKLPKEQTTNPYLHKVVNLDYFFIRKVLLVKYSYAFIVLPGGFGTLDEMFETLTLIQTGIINNFPVVVMDRNYYADLMSMIEKMVAEKTIHATDLNLLLFTDEIDKAMDHINEYINLNYKVKPKPKRWWLLGE